MKEEIIRARTRAICRQLKQKGANCLLLTSPANVTYATGFMGDDSWAMVTPGRTYLLTDSRYTEQAQKECPDCSIIERVASLAEAAGRLVRRLKSVRSVTVEKSASLADFHALKKSLGLPLKAAADIVETVRAVKDAGEISNIKAAASIAAKALRRTLCRVKPGMTENEFAGLLDYAIRTLGARNSFDTIVAFGPNASRPHHQPGHRRLKATDTVLIDFGARYNGYCSDVTRCFVLGEATAFYRTVYDVVERAQAAAIKLIKPGAEIAEVDAAPRAVIRTSNLPVYGHGTGHGFGLEIHEAPFLKVKAVGRLRAGQVITIEPGVYIPGRLGVRIEDDVLITDTGARVLTRNCPHSYLLPS